MNDIMSFDQRDRACHKFISDNPKLTKNWKMYDLSVQKDAIFVLNDHRVIYKLVIEGERVVKVFRTHWFNCIVEGSDPKVRVWISKYQEMSASKFSCNMQDRRRTYKLESLKEGIDYFSPPN